MIVILSTLLWLSGCGAPGPLPPEQRHTRSSAMQPLATPEAYRVVRGDTLYSIAFRYGLDWREVARWNGIGAPYTIRVDQWLRLHPPERMSVAVRRDLPRPRTASPPRSAPSRSEPEAASPSQPEPAPVDAPSRTPADPASSEGSRPASSQAAAPPEPAASGATRTAGGVVWRWPTAGRVQRGFDANDVRKGILIAGQDGQAVHAAANGEVVYSGNGLIGYGELVIVKHSDRMLSAYAHNRERLVAEGERVRAGQLIARMGRNEDGAQVLHFEIRRDGSPVDPARYLPEGR